MTIEAGLYRARAIAGSEQYGQTKNGTDQIVIDMELPDIGQTASVFLYFSEAAAPHSMKRLRLAGWTGNDLTNLENLGSRECEVSVKYEEYNGEQKMKVEIVSGGTVKLDKTLDDKGKKAFGAKFKALAASTPVVAGSAPSNGTGAKPAGDIPF